jgi:hypothetical protein
VPGRYGHSKPEGLALVGVTPSFVQTRAWDGGVCFPGPWAPSQLSIVVYSFLLLVCIGEKSRGQVTGLDVGWRKGHDSDERQRIFSGSNQFSASVTLSDDCPDVGMFLR